MKLPKSLYIGYRLLGESRLITKRDSDPEALQYFQTVLNKAQPVSSEELLLHRFVRAMYNENKNKFLSFIRNTYFECLVLWTDHVTIVNFTGLRGVIYIEWNNTSKSYAISRFRTRGKERETETETKTLVRNTNKYTQLDSKETDGEPATAGEHDTDGEPATAGEHNTETPTVATPTVQKKKQLRRLNKNESWANVVDSD